MFAWNEGTVPRFTPVTAARAVFRNFGGQSVETGNRPPGPLLSAVSLLKQGTVPLVRPGPFRTGSAGRS